jgi:hypothetical protein
MDTEEEKRGVGPNEYIVSLSDMDFRISFVMLRMVFSTCSLPFQYSSSNLYICIIIWWTLTIHC